MNACITCSCSWCSPRKGSSTNKCCVTQKMTPSYERMFNLVLLMVLCRTKMTLNIQMYFKLGLTRGVPRKGLFHEQA